jgi:hypothetical protein
VLKKNFRIDGGQSWYYCILYKNYEANFKFSPNSKIGFIVREAEYVVDRYNIFNEKTKHVKDWKFFSGHLRDHDKSNLNMRTYSL